MTADPEPVQEIDEPRLVDLLREHESSILGYAMRRVHDRTAAIEIRQATYLDFLIYWRRRGGLPDDDARRILYTLARRKVGKWLAAQCRGEIPTDDDLLARWLGSEDASEQIGRRVDVARALAQLTAEHRTVLGLVCVEGLSYSDAAALMHTTRDQVNNLLRAAKKAARELPELSGYHRKEGRA